jgi:chemotaxis protein CheC
MEEVQISEKEKQVLVEISTIGMGNASSALEQLLQTKIDLSVPQIDIIRISEVQKHFKDDEVLLGIVFKILGNLKGKLLYLFNKKDAYKMIDMIHNLQPSEPKQEITEEMKVSTIKEISNILSGSYLNALSSFLSMNILPSLPHLAMDTAASIFELASLSEEENIKLILIKSKLGIQGGEFDVVGSLIFELKEDQLKRLFDKIKEKYKSAM